MKLDLTDIGTIMTVLGILSTFIGWAIKSSVINPLNESIKSLQKTIEAFRATVSSLERSQHDTAKELAVLSEKVESIGQRMGNLEKDLQDTKGRVQYKAY